MAHQRLEHGEVAAGEWQGFIAPAQLTGAEVEDKGTKAHHAGLHRGRAWQLSLRSAAQHRMDARQQFARVKGLCQVVVGAYLEANNAVHVLSLGGEHDDGRWVLRAAQASANRQTVFVRQHQVEHDQVDALAQQNTAQRPTIFGLQHGKALLAEVAAQQVSDARIVVDNHDLVGSLGGLVHAWLLPCFWFADCAGPRPYAPACRPDAHTLLHIWPPKARAWGVKLNRMRFALLLLCALGLFGAANGQPGQHGQRAQAGPAPGPGGDQRRADLRSSLRPMSNERPSQEEPAPADLPRRQLSEDERAMLRQQLRQQAGQLNPQASPDGRPPMACPGGPGQRPRRGPADVCQ